MGCQLRAHMLPHVQVLWKAGGHRARVRASSATLSRHDEPTNVSTAADDDAAAADDVSAAAARDADGADAAADVGAVSVACPRTPPSNFGELFVFSGQHRLVRPSIRSASR